MLSLTESEARKISNGAKMPNQKPPKNAKSKGPPKNLNPRNPLNMRNPHT